MKEDIETVIDRLLDFVQTNGRVRLNAAARALALKPAQVEKLALLLEENDLLEVRYTFTGISLVEKEFEEKQRERVKTGDAKKRATKILRDIKSLEREVMTSEHLLEFIEKDITRRLKKAELTLKELSKAKEYTASELEYVKNEVNAVDKQLNAFDNEIIQLKKARTEFDVHVKAFEARLSKLKAVRREALTAVKPENLPKKLKEIVTELVAHPPTLKAVEEEVKEVEKGLEEIRRKILMPRAPPKAGVALKIKAGKIKAGKAEPKKPLRIHVRRAKKKAAVKGKSKRTAGKRKRRKK